MSTGTTLLLCALSMLTACHGGSSEGSLANSASHKRAAVVKRAPTPDEMTVGMIEAVTLGKSSVPVGVKFGLESQPTVGRPLSVTLAVMPQILADPAVLTVAASDAFRLAAPFAPVEIPDADSTHVYRHEVWVTPTREGVQLLALSVSLKHDEVTETRSFAVPIIVVND